MIDKDKRLRWGEDVYQKKKRKKKDVYQVQSLPPFTVLRSPVIVQTLLGKVHQTKEECDMYMSHSQMLGKFEYTLPAKF